MMFLLEKLPKEKSTNVNEPMGRLVDRTEQGLSIGASIVSLARSIFTSFIVIHHFIALAKQ